MTYSVGSDLHLSKAQLLDRAEPGVIPQTGAAAIHTDFPLPNVYAAVPVPLPSIETFVVSAADRSISPTGENAELNDAWRPAIQAMTEQVFAWLDANDVQLSGDAYVTASITPANEVNGEAHFDDDMYSPNDGVGVVAITADRAGSRVCTQPLMTMSQQRRPLISADEFKADFEAGKLVHQSFTPGSLVVFPQFGQLHAGPGPCGPANEVRHLLVFRAATTPTISPS